MSAETRCNDDAALRMEAQHNARLAPVRLNIPEVNAGTKVSADPALQTDNQLMAFLRRRDADVVEIDNLSNAIIYICEDMTKVPVTMQWAVTLAGGILMTMSLLLDGSYGALTTFSRALTTPRKIFVSAAARAVHRDLWVLLQRAVGLNSNK